MSKILLAGRGRPKSKCTSMVHFVTLKELGLTRNEVCRARSLARMPDELFEELRSGRITRVEALRRLRALEAAP